MLNFKLSYFSTSCVNESLIIFLLLIDLIGIHFWSSFTHLNHDGHWSYLKCPVFGNLLLVANHILHFASFSVFLLLLSPALPEIILAVCWRGWLPKFNYWVFLYDVVFQDSIDCFRCSNVATVLVVIWFIGNGVIVCFEMYFKTIMCFANIFEQIFYCLLFGKTYIHNYMTWELTQKMVVLRNDPGMFDWPRNFRLGFPYERKMFFLGPEFYENLALRDVLGTYA